MPPMMPGMPMPGMMPPGMMPPMGQGLPPGLAPPGMGPGAPGMPPRPQLPGMPTPPGAAPPGPPAGANPMAMMGPMAQLIQQNPSGAVVATGLIEALSKLVKQMTTVGEPKDKMTRVSPYAPQYSGADTAAGGGAPSIATLLSGGRPPGVV